MKMDRALGRFADVLQTFGSEATFPVTAVVVKRNPHIVQKYCSQGIEFIVHGFTHIDYSRLSPEAQLAHLKSAVEIFGRAGIEVTGFRSPYLRRDPHLSRALVETGFTYVSNQPILWDVLDESELAPSARKAYQRAIDFYDPWSAASRLSLPRLRDGLVEIPVAIPDDEILMDRVGNGAEGLVGRTWTSIFRQTYEQGELFTIQLHPERIGLCADGLSAVLRAARACEPRVWITRLDKVAEWWRLQAGTSVQVAEIGQGQLQFSVSGGPGRTIVARGVRVDAPTEPWTDGYDRVKNTNFVVHSDLRPLVGVSPGTAPPLVDFLRHQGYIVEACHSGENYSVYFDEPIFSTQAERSIVTRIEDRHAPLIKMARWPDGARSALVVTGDVDALTIWDYGLRILRR
jgi:peptidoglycan/xylan/chitin deacetylase (PgdA/CDA1 family)